MADKSALKPVPPIPAAGIGSPSSIINRGLIRLGTGEASSIPPASSWKASILWEPEWFPLIAGGDNFTDPSNDVWADAVRISNNVVIIEGFSMWEEAEFEFLWRSPSDWLYVETASDADLSNFDVSATNDKRPPINLARRWVNFYYGCKDLEEVWPRGYIEFLTAHPGYRKLDDELVFLPTFNGWPHITTGANASGVIVGGSTPSDGRVRAVQWVNDRISLIPTPFRESCAMQVNCQGQIAGWGRYRLHDNQDQNTRSGLYGFTWPVAEKCKVLSFIPSALSDNGIVVGNTSGFNLVDVHISDSRPRAMIWNGIEEIVLPIPEPYVSSFASHVSNEGVVVGTLFCEDYFRAWNETRESRSAPWHLNRVPCIWRVSSP